jgi:hypothetical protein
MIMKISHMPGPRAPLIAISTLLRATLSPQRAIDILLCLFAV